jgi:hypothetical protein
VEEVVGIVGEKLVEVTSTFYHSRSDISNTLAKPYPQHTSMFTTNDGD